MTSVCYSICNWTANDQELFPLVVMISCEWGNYRYTELSYKITSLISRTCCLGSGLTYTLADAGVMPFICDSY